jgi:type IV pilus assembly protein PilB
MIFANTPTTEIRKYCMSVGMKTLYQDGMIKVCKGFTTFEEVYRVAKRTEQDIIMDEEAAEVAQTGG